jgi:hypothetical protein
MRVDALDTASKQRLAEPCFCTAFEVVHRIPSNVESAAPLKRHHHHWTSEEDGALATA